MTTPNTANPAATQKLNVQALADAAQTSRTPYVAKAADLKGFDAEALIQFQNTLPSFKRAAAKVGEEKEEFIDANGNVIDEPQWQVAQASGGTTTDAAGGSAGGAGDGGAAGGSGGGAADGAAGGAGDGGAAGGAGGGGGAGAAGAGPATMGLAPVAMIPLALVPKNPHDNHAPTLDVSCHDGDAYTQAGAPTFASTASIAADDVGKVHFRLAINAQAGQAATGPAWNAHDPDSDTLGFFFSDGHGHRSSYAYQDGTISHLVGDQVVFATAETGFYQIDADGCISLTNLGAANVADQELYLHANQYNTGHVDLTVVAYDGALESNPMNVFLDRGITDDNLQTHLQPLQTNHLATDIQGGLHDHSDADTVYITGRISGSVDAPVNELDVVLMDPVGTYDPVNYTHLEMHREGGDLHMSLTIDDGQCGTELNVQICNEFGFDNGTQLDYVHSVEFVHFTQGSTYLDYTLNAGSGDTVCNDVSPASWYDNGAGFYQIALGLTGTDLNDLIVGSDACDESLSGGAGNDLLFSHGANATLNGGMGDDLISMGGEHNTVVLRTDWTTEPVENGDDILHPVNGTDTVAGFGNSECNVISLVDAAGNAVCTGFVDSEEIASYSGPINGVVFEVDANATEAFGAIIQNASTNPSDIFFALIVDNISGLAYLQEYVGGVDPTTGNSSMTLASFHGVSLDSFNQHNFAVVPV